MATTIGAPMGYPCQGDDAWVVIQVTTARQWEAMQTLIPELAGFGDLASRLQQRENLNATIAQWTAQLSSEAAMHLLQSKDITAAKLNNGEDLLHEPQLKDRQYLQWLERDYVGLQPNASAPFRTEAAPIPIESPAPTLGQHNHFVLEDILQLSESEIAELAELGIIGTKPRLPKTQSP